MKNPEIGDIVMVHLSSEITKSLNGNHISDAPAIVVGVWPNEYPGNPVDNVGVNVRILTDSQDNPIWLTSLQVYYKGIGSIYGKENDDVNTFSMIRNERLEEI